MVHLRVLTATGIEELDKEIASKLALREIEVAGECYYREGLLGLAKERGADVVVLSPQLPGDGEILEAVKNLRLSGLRVVLLPGRRENEAALKLARRSVTLGVYDLVWDPVSPAVVVHRIERPATLAEAGVEPDLEEEPVKIDQAENKTPVQRIKRPPIFNGKGGSKENQPTTPARPRTGTPHVILAMGRELNRSFQAMFSNLIEIAAEVSTAEEFKKAVMDDQPDIAVIMRTGPAGGVPEADALAEWAASHVPEILFIAGELDETGSSMVERVQNAGVSHILSCPPGGYISGEELVYLMQNIVRKMQEAEADIKDAGNRVKVKQNPVEGLQTLKINATKLGKILKPASAPKNKPAKKKIKPARINMKEGIALDERPEEEQINSVKNPTAIIPGGLFAVCTPWRPGLAGRIAAQAVKMLAERGRVAYIAATGQSTGAVWLDVPEEELIMSDWRVPGSQAPVQRDNISIYAVDPAKNLNNISNGDLWDLVKSVRKDATYTVLDFGSDINAAQQAAFAGRSVVLVIVPGGDPVETKTSMLWLKTLQEGKQNIVPGVDLRGCPPAVPEGLEPKVIIRNNPADALSMALRSNEKDEFIWNR